MQNQKEYLDFILNLTGADEFKELVKDLETFRQNKDKYPIHNTPLPAYFWVLKRGGGIKTCVSAFADYLYASKLFQFSGKERCIMHRLDYVRPDSPFAELTRLDNTIKINAGYHRFFQGVVCIDICDWEGVTNEPHFTILLKYLENNMDKILPIMYMHTSSEDKIKSVETSLSAHIRFDTVHFRFPEPHEVVDLIEAKLLSQNNISLSKEAKSVMTETITDVSKNENFNGFVTIEQITNDFLYHLYQTELHKNKVSEKALQDYIKKSDYINRLKVNKPDKQKLGF